MERHVGASVLFFSLCAVLGAGCGGGTTGAPDTGTHDAGSLDGDTHAFPDGGVGPTDTGATPTDTGTTPTDTGATPTDTGVTDVDGGTTDVDTGVADVDGGTVDAGDTCTSLQAGVGDDCLGTRICAPGLTCQSMPGAVAAASCIIVCIGVDSPCPCGLTCTAHGAKGVSWFECDP